MTIHMRGVAVPAVSTLRTELSEPGLTVLELFERALQLV